MLSSYAEFNLQKVETMDSYSETVQIVSLTNSTGRGGVAHDTSNELSVVLIY